FRYENGNIKFKMLRFRSIKMDPIRKFTIILQIAFLIFIAAFTAMAAGEVDTTFNASAYINDNFGAKVVIAQPDGKILVGGDSFTVANGVARHGIVRLNADGSVDAGFDPPVFYDPEFGTLGKTITTISLQSNCKIMVGCLF